MHSLYSRYNPWWDAPENAFKGLIDRPKFSSQLEKHLHSKPIIFLSGLRRSGKTSLLKLAIRQLIHAHNISPRHILYLSLDDYVLSPKPMTELIDQFRKIHKLKFSEKIYLFFDEVTYLPDFEIQLKNIYDTQKVKLFASASSATGLRNKKPLLTGRTRTLAVQPLDFNEYLNFKRIDITARDEHLRAAYFEDFMQSGGLPEYVLSGNMEYLKALVDDLIYKDIVAQYHIRDAKLIKDYFMLLMERAGKVLSVNKIARILSIAPDSANRYLQMFADTYLIHLIARHGATNARLLAPKKIYAPDLGIRCLFTGLRDKGALFENYVYLQINQLNPSYIYQDETEIDFITDQQTLVEVKYGQPMTEKQKKLFNTYPAKQRILVGHLDDIKKIK